MQTHANGAQLIGLGPRAGMARRFAVSNNFIIERLGGPGGARSFESGEETIVLFPTSGGTAEGYSGVAKAPPFSVAVAPAGRYTVAVDGPGDVVIFATHRPDLDPAAALNAGRGRDARVAAVGRPFERRHPLGAPQFAPVMEIPPPIDNPRLRFLQSATISLNLIVYEGARGKRALSPHSHPDIEQGTFTLEGDYVHHLRTPWGPNGEEWIEDAHLEAHAGDLILIPPNLIHTTEGVGAGRHVLIDIFAPPRRDFIAKGWMSNAADYRDPATLLHGDK